MKIHQFSRRQLVCLARVEIMAQQKHSKLMLIQLLIFSFIQLGCCICAPTSLHTGIRTNVSTENEIPDHLHP